LNSRPPVLRWSRPANSPTITGFRIQWTRNGSNVGSPVTVPTSAASDTAGYSSTYSAAGAGAPVTGDVIGAAIVSNDSTNSLDSIAVAAPPVTIPAEPPPPANVTLALV
jgi:hypothetical protein